MTASRPTSAVVVGASGGIGGALVRALAERATHAPIFALSRSGSSPPSGRVSYQKMYPKFGAVSRSAI